MNRRSERCYLVLTLLATLTIAVGLAQAASKAIGDLAGGSGVTVSGAEARSHTTVYSGDSVEVKEGIANVSLGRGNRMEVGAQTKVSFERDAEGITAVLGRGNVSFRHLTNATAVRLKAEDLTILPAGRFQTVGEVAVLDGAWRVTAREGSLRVVGPAGAVDVAKGKTIVITKLKAPPGAPGIPAAGAHIGNLGKGLIVSSAGAAGLGVALKPKNPVAVSHVGEHVPPPACEHAASPSVPAEACP